MTAWEMETWEAEKIKEIKQFCADNPGAEYTFGHIVLADYNISKQYIFGCFDIDNINLWMNADEPFELIDQMELNVKVARFLQKLLGDYNDSMG